MTIPSIVDRGKRGFVERRLCTAGNSMKYGIIAGNSSINRKIYACFEHISERDARSFVKKFAEQPHEETQVMHTFRELLVGAYLGSRGFSVANEHLIGSKTPDWSILGHGGSPRAIIEVVNFHIDRTTEEQIERQFRQGQAWAGWRGETPNTDRLYSALQRKFAAYKDLASQFGLPYIVCVHGDFLANVQLDELDNCLLVAEHSLFQAYAHVSGVLFFEIDRSDYVFKYRANPTATIQFPLPDGVF
jgi:hypothetical protein